MKIPALQSLFNKVKEKETSTQVFSCEYCEILKNTLFKQHQRIQIAHVVASILLVSTT